jgi:hypothetical protein
MAPPSGEYGPVPWSIPRPLSLWLYVFLLLPISVLPTIGSRIGDLPWLGWALTIGCAYLLLRGSRLFWWLGVILGALGTWGFFAQYLGNRDLPGTHIPVPELSLIAGILSTVAWILLILPSTRRFFNLEWRRGNFPTPAPAVDALPASEQ